MAALEPVPSSHRSGKLFGIQLLRSFQTTAALHRWALMSLIDVNCIGGSGVVDNHVGTFFLMVQKYTFFLHTEPMVQMVSGYLVMLNVCFLDIPHTFLAQGECPEPIRNHLCEQNDRQATHWHSGVR